jgi:hypothetical protein
MSNDDAYKVGYKCPPLASRFQPGRSGNPGGRPKGCGNFKSLVQAAANREIKVTVWGQQVMMTKAEAFVDKLLNDAFAGDSRLRTLVAMLFERYLVDDADDGLDTELRDHERKLLKQYRDAQGGSDEPQAR